MIIYQKGEITIEERITKNFKAHLILEKEKKTNKQTKPTQISSNIKRNQFDVPNPRNTPSYS